MKNTSKQNVQPKSAEITETVDVLPEMNVPELPTDDLATEMNATGAVVTLDKLLGLSDETEFQIVNGVLSDAPVANSVTVTPVANPFTVTPLPPVSNTHRIMAMKRAIHSKKLLMEFHASKVADWRLQSIHRTQKATADYHSRKAELEEQMVKNELKYQKSMEKTRIHWDEYSDNYEKTKIQKIADELLVLETELANLEAMAVLETPVVVAETPIGELQPLAVA